MAPAPTNAADSTAWERATAIPPLGVDELQLWRISIHQPDSVTARWRASLSADETAALARYRFPADAQRLLASRGARRWLLAHHLGLAPSALAFTPGPHGKPTLAPTPDFKSGAFNALAPRPETPNSKPQTPNPSPLAPLEFNSSHSGDWLLFALTRRHPVGVDVERWRDLPDRALVIRYFAPAEIAEWTALPEPQRTAGFFNGWSRKEAYLKALGAGLAKPLDSFQVRLAPDHPAALLADTEDPSRVAHWRLLAVPMPPGYTAALALPRPITRIHRLEWALE